MSENANVSDEPLVCVVDDDSLIRSSTQRLIHSLGFQVEAFASTEEFGSAGCLDETACLILDVRMSGMSGIELQRQLASTHPELPVIFITAYEDALVKAQAIRQGAVAMLIKPFSEEELLDALHAALESRMTTSQTTLTSNEPKMRSARPGANPRNKLMWTETNRFRTDDRAGRTQTGDLKLEQYSLKECLSRHWVASAVAAWKRTWGHGCGLRQRDLLRQRELCFARGCRALLQAGSAYL